ncbi:MAG TPA: hypothetical protein DEQ74_02330 [Wolbachia sp.]|jgi:hypothetical protein|uniref:hypothetical protein n=1 Tax=Wolbachia endosymbiont of Pentalonia nigronervosa TaxID=1301914 RepID=UPI000EBBBB5C|nr:hypothetical protein [Wolbachia endosymbiont of Pentalonia nigronervosa]MBD0391856.1 hypothetical protein [Wolbachia endosymbiont of Pentalonia nigronervosa]HCE59645.1 hypothetical protein [Wolbachia sp.]
MPGDLFAFFDTAPAGGFEIESSLCIDGQCNKYEGNINPDDIWTSYLTSPDGKTTKEVKASVVDFFKPAICFSMKDQGKDISLEVSLEDCEFAEDGSLHINKSSQDYTFNIVIKAAKA